MGKRGKPAERKRQDRVPLPATRVRDEPDPAGVVLERRVVERRDRARPARARCTRVASLASLWRFDGHPDPDSDGSPAGAGGGSTGRSGGAGRPADMWWAGDAGGWLSGVASRRDAAPEPGQAW
jgi:hypothetical protein